MKRLKIFKTALIASLAAISLQTMAQTAPSNKPTTATQVPAPSLTTAATPSGYTTGGISPKVNWVRERDAMGRITDTAIFDAASYLDVKQTTRYIDGLGRPIQAVARQSTSGPQPLDLVSPVVYDPFGREVYKYLPYVQNSGNKEDGEFKRDPFTDQKNFYQNIYPGEQPAYTGEQVYYSQTQYEASPLNRVLKSMAPGNNWAGSNIGVSQQYLSNIAEDNVVIWNISSDALTYVNNDISTNIPMAAGYYAAGQLYKTVALDEQAHAVVEYTDRDGLLVLKKVQLNTVPSDYSGYQGWLSTYYIYDDLNQLRFVLSPKATTIASANSWNLNADATVINELCFRYEYDERKRMSAKKVPGAAWTYMIYDQRDRLVYTQDGNMRGHNQWMTTLYDAMNRPSTTGMLTYTGNPAQLQAYVKSHTGLQTNAPFTVTGTAAAASQAVIKLEAIANGDQRALQEVSLEDGFVTPDNADFIAEIAPGNNGSIFTGTFQVLDNPLPSPSDFIPLTLTFYDDYSQLADRQYTSAYNSLLDAGNNTHVEAALSITDQQSVQTIGQVTGTRVRVIEDPNDLTKGAWLTTAHYFDDRLRLVQTQTDNYRGGKEIMTSLYNFTGQVIASYMVHNNPSAADNSTTRIKTNLNYDHANRLLEVYKTINDDISTKRLLARSDYDQMGLFKQKHLGQLPTDGSFLETQDYSYNIRGWLKGINKDYANNDNSHGGNCRWFGMELSYDWGFGSNQLNGNIAGTKWRSKGDGMQRAYGFAYDVANRFLTADFNQYSGGEWNKSAQIDFSAVMGNGINGESAYDENGNILQMYQQGWQLGGSVPIDALQYTYYDNTNKLKNVIDGQNKPETTLGDFRTSSLSPYISGRTSGDKDYWYDDNGNMTRDLNKDIGSLSTNGIIYNHLNLPWQITVRGAAGTKGTITYIYDAVGTKLEKRTVDNEGDVQTRTAYLGAFQYQGKNNAAGSAPADTLLFFGHEEGRVRVAHDYTGNQPVASFKYDYFIKDHLGNTRVVLTDEQESDQYIAATMEESASQQETVYYTNLDNTRADVPAGYPNDPTTNPNAKVARLNGAETGPKIGPGITLKVMAGDQFSLQVSSWYRLNGIWPGAPVNPLSDLVAGLISGVGKLPGGGHPSVAAMTTNNTLLNTNMTQFLSDTGTSINSSKPHAFVNWILFDNQFNYVAESSGFEQVGADQEFKKHTKVNLPITKSGYLYIYLSNETPNVNVFFDNLQVTHTRGAMLEEDHYYPFGLTMEGISDKALKSQYRENKYRFNGGTELANNEFSDGSGIEIYETPYRGYNAQLGIFHQIDPLSDIMSDWSPYAYALNNPISYNDSWGLQPDDSTAKPKSPGADVPEMTPVIVSHKKNDCVTCDAKKIDMPSPPSSVPSPIKQGAAGLGAGALTVTALGNSAEATVTVTGGGFTLPLLVIGGSIYSIYSTMTGNHPAPILNVPSSDIPRFAPSVALPIAATGTQPRQHAYTYATEPWGEQYTLRAAADGLYPVFQWGKGQVGMQHLSRGDIWKIGTTFNGVSRYSDNFYNTTGAGLYFESEFVGPLDQILFVERMKLINYAMQNGGNLPPGNTKLQ